MDANLNTLAPEVINTARWVLQHVTRQRYSWMFRVTRLHTGWSTTCERWRLASVRRSRVVSQWNQTSGNRYALPSNHSDYRVRTSDCEHLVLLANFRTQHISHSNKSVLYTHVHRVNQTIRNCSCCLSDWKKKKQNLRNLVYRVTHCVKKHEAKITARAIASYSEGKHVGGILHRPAMLTSLRAPMTKSVKCQDLADDTPDISDTSS